MALRVVTMTEMRLEVLLEPERTGESIAAVCRRHGISRDTFYRYRRRYLLEGLQGLDDRSRRPERCPGQIPDELEVEICRLRGLHPRWGARRIAAELTRGGSDAPAVSTIHQVLRRNHLVADQPPRRPKATKRFCREVSNDLWQIDATELRLADRTKAHVLDMIDDYSRLLLAAVASPAPSGDAAWDCFETASSRYGLPRQVLSDNGLCFTGRLHGVEVAFERNLSELGVQLINAGPYHPQTLGKLERFHRTLKDWLADEGPAEDLVHLQELLDGFRHHYNSERPHQAIGDLTPAERYSGMDRVLASDAPQPWDMAEPTYPPHSIVRKVNTVGTFGYRRRLIHVGTRWAGARVRIIPVGALVHVYHGERLLRVLTLDPDTYYHGYDARKEVPPPRSIVR